MNKTMTWHPAMPPAGLRRVVARTMRLTGRQLVTWASRLLAEPRAPAHEPMLEFYAEAGAPEGALYVDGRRVGVLPGVTRL
jgi:hypothetical protein